MATNSIAIAQLKLLYLQIHPLKTIPQGVRSPLGEQTPQEYYEYQLYHVF